MPISSENGDTVPDSAGPPLRIVLLTTRTSHGAAILEALRDDGIGVAGVIVEQPSTAVLRSKLARTRRQLGVLEAQRALFRRFRRIVRARLRRDHWSTIGYYSCRVDQVERVASLNGSEAQSLLRELEPDIVVLGGAPILRVEILDVPRLGTINAHPGLLPSYRGVDVIPWAVLNGDPVGVTVHLVDAGIDTGAVLRQGELTIEPGDTIERLRSRAEALAGRLVVATVRDAQLFGEFVPTVTTADRGPLYRRMSRDDLARAAATLRSTSGSTRGEAAPHCVRGVYP